MTTTRKPTFHSLRDKPEEQLALVIKTQRWANEGLKRRDLSPETRAKFEQVNARAWSAQKAGRSLINVRKRNAQKRANRPSSPA